MAATVLQLEQCLEEVSHWMSANCLRLSAVKTELLWMGTKYSQPSLGSKGKGLPLQIDSNTVTASDYVRMLGVTFSADLNLDKHVSSIFALCIVFLLATPTLTSSTIPRYESMKTLVHTFVTARVDYCNMVLASSPRSVTDELQRVLSATACLVSGMCNYDGPMWQIRSGTSSELQCTNVSTTKHHSIW